jgi:hypothetical protein
MNLKLLTCTSAVMLTLGASILGAGAPTAAAQPGGGQCGPERCPQVGRPGGPAGPGDFRGPGGPHGPGGYPAGRPWEGGPPPRDLAWRGIDQGRFDHQPFNYRGSWVSPFFNPQFNNWGFWFLGVWVPL